MSSGWNVARLEVRSRAAGELNEDGAGQNGLTFWVLDGSTPLFPRSDAPSAHWFVGRAADLLAARPTGEPVLEQLEHVERSLQLELAARGVGPTELERTPSAAVGVVRIDGDAVEVAVLGDVTVVVESGGSHHVFDDPRVEPLDRLARSVLVALQDEGVSYDEAWPQVRRVLRENRLRMNRDDTYWILSGNPEGPAHAVRERLPLEGAARILLATDGLARVVSDFGIYADWAEAVEAVARGSLDTLLDALRQAEADDPQCRRVPRLKPVDDATGLYVELVADHMSTA